MNYSGFACAAALLLAGCVAAGSAPPAAASGEARAAATSSLLSPCRRPGVEQELRCGTIIVEENRVRPNGRRLGLDVVVIPARDGPPAAEPVFYLVGGPGQPATDMAVPLARFGTLPDREIVLVDQRGSGGEHRLDCGFAAAEENLQRLLEPLFNEGLQFRVCREELERRADLTQYTTWHFVQDLDETRRLLGYERINLEGGSYGTKAAFVYMQAYPERVRAAMLSGIAALSNRSPLYHAAAAQRAFELMARQCRAEPGCTAAFDPVADLAALLRRFSEGPVPVTIPHPDTGAPVPIEVGQSAFGEGLRAMLYSVERRRSVPLLLSRARAGDLAPFAVEALRNSLGSRRALRLGLLLSATCSEDVARIRPEEIGPATAGSFIGDYRVRGQIAACAHWPPAILPAGFFDSKPVPVPALLISGNLDPVTPPEWGEEMRRYLPTSLHLIGSGAHVEMDACLAGIRQLFFATATVSGLDTSCLDRSAPPPFRLAD